MNNIRSCQRIFTIDRLSPYSSFTWGEESLEDVLKYGEIHDGLKLISEHDEVSIKVCYTNITFIYHFYFGSFKKNIKRLDIDDERWKSVEEVIFGDLKVMGLESLLNDIMNCLKNNKYYEFDESYNIQFKNYFVSES